MLPQRNCVSADTAKQAPRIAPANVRGLRKTMFVHKKQSSCAAIRTSQKGGMAEEGDVSLWERAKGLAKQCVEREDKKTGGGMEALLDAWQPM